MERGQFPKGFLWGASTSAHQVEGGLRNDWTEWEKKNVEYFLRFVEKIADAYKNDVTHFIVLNEPNIYTAFGFITGSHPPGIKNIFKAKNVYLNLRAVQKGSDKVIHNGNPRAQVGIANSFMYFE